MQKSGIEQMMTCTCSTVFEQQNKQKLIGILAQVFWHILLELPAVH
jgi:hypothetical protein